MPTDAATTACPTCGETRDPSEFYAGSTECKPCKRQRSQQNRAAVSVKATLFDRLVAVLEQLAAQGWTPDALLIAQMERGPVSDSAAGPGPSIGPQEVQP